MQEYKILVVEDEEATRSLIQLFLENRKFIVFSAANGQEAMEVVQEQELDLILLDIEMPGLDGFEVCEKIREQLNIPIIFISSRRDVMGKVKSFELGGDDYLTKPFDFAELEARIRASLRRYGEIQHATSSTVQQNILKYGELEINLDSCICYVNGKEIPLSAKEMEILIVLAKHPNHVWSNEKLYDHIWGYDSLGDVQTVKVHISNLRKKINQYATNTTYIETVRGFGYRFTG